MTSADLTAARLHCSSFPRSTHPEDYGAVGDGVHDDWSAVQAAFSIASAAIKRPEELWDLDGTVHLVVGARYLVKGVVRAGSASVVVEKEPQA